MLRVRQGDLDSAERLQREAVEILTEALGPDHPKTATGLQRLGETLGQAGRTDEAERLLRRALSILEDGLPPDHPQVAEVRDSLSAVVAESSSR